MWAEALAMIDRAEQLHRQFCQPGLGAGPRANWEPPVDVFENGRDVLIVVALPGVESQDLEVRSEPDALVVAGLRRLPVAAAGMAIERLEIPHGQFERRIRLPAARWQLQRSMLANGCLLLNLTRQP
jgi:HSP20 family molecular chaperone IbpA